MKRKLWRKIVNWTMIVAAIVFGYVIVILAFLPILNSDLYGRLTETKTAKGVGDSTVADLNGPTIRLVLQRLPNDENAVEASLLLYVYGDLCQQVKVGKTHLKAIVIDGSSFEPYGLKHSVTLDKVSTNADAGDNVATVQSERFRLPTYPSVEGFPFDDMQVRPMVYLLVDDIYTLKFKFEVQKAVPGRLMEISDDNITTIRLTRSPTEKLLIVVSSIVFLLLSAMVSYGLFKLKRGFSNIEEIVAVAGYLIATAGFREILGISRLAGTSAFEIVIIGFPLVIVSVGVLVSFIRGYFSRRRAKTSDPKPLQDQKD